MPKSDKGFTLVELSLTIVVIGLIIASITAGQSLITSAKIRSQISDIKKFEVAYNTFKLEYDAIPGDMPNASSYWPSSTNGDGDGRITERTDRAWDLINENITFFEHLSHSELIPETYTHVFQIDIGYPSLKIDNSKGMTTGGYIRSGGNNIQLSDEEAERVIRRRS